MNSLYQNIDRMEEGKANIYSKKHGKKKVKIKGMWLDGWIVRLKYRVVERLKIIKKSKSGENVRGIVIVQW